MGMGAMALIGGFGFQELVVILLIVLIVFGATRIPQVMRGLGQGVREFKDAVKSDPEKDQPTPPEQKPDDK